MSWINDTGPLGDVVLSSRVRLARNLSDTPFPSIADKSMTDSVIHRVHRSVSGQGSPIRSQYQFLAMGDLAPTDREILVEKHLASPDLLENPERSAILINREEICSIMVNEEDHIRMQCIFPGYQLRKALEYLNRIDDVLEGQLPYAYDADLGYLTCCPTNLGTGMRASVMMHLPLLVGTGQMKAIIQTLPKIGVAVRGLYGEGSEAIGDIYQISNQITLGASEEEIIMSLEVVTKQIVDKEKEARRRVMERGRVHFEDGIWRAYGTMTHARVMDLNEFMSLLSKVRLGVEMGIIPNVDISTINELMVMGQPAHLKKYRDGDTAIKDLDEVRARVVAEKLRQ
ncbi:MAG: protein arginine kinase [Caldicoprobacterales bacterium]|jgi:protein arginine kinase|nr:protein arginine kinase [Clostridiales bacterium]